MKKLILIFSITLLCASTAFSQLVFERIGGNPTVGSTGPNYAYAYVKNTGTSPIGVRFQRTVNQLPNDSWTSSICVGVCYAPFVDMVPLEGEDAHMLEPGQVDTMDITYDAPTLGSSHVVIRMFVDANPSQYIERDFDLNVTSVGISNISTIAETYSLSQNFPNPFNPTTSIRFSIPSAGNVDLKVYDALGNEVSNVVNNQKLSAGEYSVDFNASRLSSGIYYYTLRADNFFATKKMMLIK